jgi:hypothetical protein
MSLFALSSKKIEFYVNNFSIPKYIPQNSSFVNKLVKKTFQLLKYLEFIE